MNEDKLYDAYIGNLGSDVQKDTQMRIDWILQKAGHGKKLLDCGCSEGIISILAAEQDNEVLGIDVNETAIQTADQLLTEYYSHVKDKVRFQVKNLRDIDGEELYDGIILCEVLEHLDNPEEAVHHLAGLLKSNGVIIITVPFGYMPHPDHKASYYLTKLYQIADSAFDIQDYAFLGHWMGLSANKKVNQSSISLEELYPVQEQHFLKLEKESRDKYLAIREKSLNCNQKYKQAGIQYKTIKQQLMDCQDRKRECLNKQYQRELLSEIVMLLELENELYENRQSQTNKHTNRWIPRFQWLSHILHLSAKEEDQKKKQMEEFIRERIDLAEKKLEDTIRKKEDES